MYVPWFPEEVLVLTGAGRPPVPVSGQRALPGAIADRVPCHAGVSQESLHSNYRTASQEVMSATGLPSLNGDFAAE